MADVAGAKHAGPARWCVSVEEQIYGPYSDDEMRGFAEEAQNVGESRVAPERGEDGRPAADVEQTGAAIGGRKFGAAIEPVETNFIVVADIRSRPSGPFEKTLKALGQAYEKER